MHTRSATIDDFLQTTPFATGTRVPLLADASFRRYERIHLNDKTAILMDAPPEKEDVRPFIKVAEHLVSHGFSAPRIIARDEARGFLLLEDLGDDSFTKLLNGISANAGQCSERELYLAATDALVELHHHSEIAELHVAHYDEELLVREASLFADWFLPRTVGAETALRLRAEFLALWRGLIQKIPSSAPVLVLRDYHADNLLWLKDRAGIEKVGLLDFQDAVRGHAAYDLVSILEDARRDVDPQVARDCIAHYMRESNVDADAFTLAYAVLGAQRNTKIIGIFNRLCVRDSKTHYLDYLPRVWAHLAKDVQHPALSPLAAWFETHVPDDVRTSA